MLIKEITISQDRSFKFSHTFTAKTGAEKNTEEMFPYYCLTKKNRQLIKRRCSENQKYTIPHIFCLNKMSEKSSFLCSKTAQTG